MPRDLKVCDYGCGTLHVGAHLMNYLNPSCFLDLDVSEQLIGLGRVNFKPLIDEKRPRFGILNRSFDPTKVEPADLTVCFNVACHVHPDECADFYSRIQTIAAKPGSLVLMHVLICSQPIRYQASGWADTRENYVARMAPLEPVDHSHEILGELEKGPYHLVARVLAFRRPSLQKCAV